MILRVGSDRTPQKRFPLQTFRIISGRNLGPPNDIGTVPAKK